MSKTVTALFKDRTAASHAVDGLLSRGITRNDVSVLMADSTHKKEFAVEVNSKAPEGTAAGAAIGGAAGAIAAGLTAVGTVALTGGGAGAAAGGLAGGLIGLGFDENEAKLVDKDIENGSILVAAEVTSKNDSDIKKYFKDSGASQVTVH